MTGITDCAIYHRPARLRAASLSTAVGGLQTSSRSPAIRGGRVHVQPARRVALGNWRSAAWRASGVSPTLRQPPPGPGGVGRNGSSPPVRLGVIGGEVRRHDLRRLRTRRRQLRADPKMSLLLEVSSTTAVDADDRGDGDVFGRLITELQTLLALASIFVPLTVDTSPLVTYRCSGNASGCGRTPIGIN